MHRRLVSTERTWTREDRAAGQVREIPFEVPGGVGALRLELAYTGPAGAVLDLGLSGPDGHVGWSGGARSSVVVSAGWSTPGYLTTLVVPGEWAVLVGLHRTPEPGVTMQLSVDEADTRDIDAARAQEPADPVPVSAPPPRRLPELDGMRWLAGDFHAHSVHSDGALSLGALAVRAVGAGLDFLAVTDHNTTSHHAHLPALSKRYGIELVPGQEVTRDVGHANAFGDIGFVDFRAPLSSWEPEVTARGGVFSVNHPLAADCAWLAAGNPPRAAEVWHSSWSSVPTWGAPLAWWLARPGAIPLGGSDFHHDGADAPPGSPTTWVLARDADVLDAVHRGRTAVSAGRDGPLLLPMGEELLVLDAAGLHLVQPDAGRRVIHDDHVVLPATPGPCWLEDDERVVHALTTTMAGSERRPTPLRQPEG